jgi:very-short-patch-repair endonuclease
VQYLHTEKAKKRRKELTDIKKIHHWEKTYKMPCIICGTMLAYPRKKTCNEICHKIYRSKANVRIMSDETKLKISNSILAKYGRTSNFDLFNLSCIECSKEFTNRTKNAKYCSDCRNKVIKIKISNSMKLAFKEGRHKGNEYRNRKNKSYLERSFITYLKDNYPSLEYVFNEPVKIYNNEKKYIKNYYIDFFLPKTNIGIELDGKQHEKCKEYDQNRDQLIYDTRKIKIVRVSYNEYFECSKYDLINNLLKEEMAA